MTIEKPEAIKIIPPNKDMVDILKEIVHQNSMIVKSIVNPMMIIQDVDKEDKEQ